MLRIGITPGEPAGVGPELVVRLAQQNFAQELELVAIADPALLRQSAEALKLPLTLNDFNSGSAQVSGSGRLSIEATPLAAAVAPGKLNAQNSAYVIETLRLASSMCLQNQLDALVTAPVHKAVINEAGVPFSGHTEYFAEQADCSKVVMMLATEGLRVALATTHLPLRKVADAITKTGLSEVIQILNGDLKNKFGIPVPRILVCGLNPHAGENGHLGMEEIEVIEPALRKLRSEGINLVGPLPADTLFTEHNLEGADAVLAMYHDQGLPVLKHKGFGKAVNITLGLPFVRTSVDHGTALDLAGKGLADISSLEFALKTAIEMANVKRLKR